MKRIISSVLSVVLILLMVSAFELTSTADNNEYSIGDIIEYGTYPQSDVTESLGSILNSQSGTWKSYGYYSGNDRWAEGQMTASNYMRYKDVTYNGEKYRGVTFDNYKKYYIGYHYGEKEEDNSYQDDNGYYRNNVYWFKYEPIKWRILDPLSGFVICNSIIDCQPINSYIIESGKTGSGGTAYWGDAEKTYYVSNYAKSLMRQWLNGTFFNTAFSYEQKENIKLTELNNDCVKTSGIEIGYEEFNAPHTEDKIFLLSFDEATNSDYGLDIKSRQRQGTDYAKCEGLDVYLKSGDKRSGNSDWWLRTPCFSSHEMCLVTCYGYAVGFGGKEADGYSATSNVLGVCPAMKLNTLKNDISVGNLEEYQVTWKADGVETVQTVSLGYPIVKPDNPVKEGYTFKCWSPDVPSIMPNKNLTFIAVFENTPEPPENPTRNANINAKSAEVYKNSKVIVKATATGVPEGYVLTIYDGSKCVATGDNASVSYELPGLIKSNEVFTVRIVDKDGNIQIDSNGKYLTKRIEIKVKTGFINNLIAFFRKLLGNNTMIIEP